MKLLQQKRINPEESIVVAITGNGYKTLDVFESQFEVDVTLRPNLKVFRDWFEAKERLAPVETPA
jgi:threonine synthase